MKKLKILRCGDQNFWAYYWISQEHSRYTIHDMSYARHNEVNLDGVDVLYIHSPDITNYHAHALTLEAKARGIKVIGAYAGNPHFWSPAEQRTYTHADLIVTISPQTYSFAKFHYTNIPVIYLPESVDTDFFTPKSCNHNRFNVGWAGGTHKKVKRFDIAKALDFPIYLKDDWKKQRNSQDKTLTLKEMRDYYRKVDVLLVTSESECQPRTVIESMATGKPVIATDVGSISMLLEPEWIVPVNPKKDVIKEINFRLSLLKKYPKMRAKVGQRNLEFINKYFSWENNKVLWDTIFESVYNDNINRAIYESKKFLFPFKKQFVSKFMKFDVKRKSLIKPVDGASLKNLLIELNESCNYFLYKESCKDAVMCGRSKGNDIYLGVNSDENYEKLETALDNSCIYSQLKPGLDIKTLKDYSIRKTKQILFEEVSVEVPFPVINYLDTTFGRKWHEQ